MRRLRAGLEQRSVAGRHRAAEHSEHLRRVEPVGRRRDETQPRRLVQVERRRTQDGLARPRTLVRQRVILHGRPVRRHTGSVTHASSALPTSRRQDTRRRKFMLPPKMGKVHQKPLRSATHHCPSLCKISSRSAKRCMRKALQFLHLYFSILAPQGDPWARVHQCLDVTDKRQ